MVPCWGFAVPSQDPREVLSVQPGTAAAAADIRVRDIIQKFNGKPVADFKELTGQIAGCREGEEASLEILRDGQTHGTEGQARALGNAMRGDDRGVRSE